MTKQPFGGTGHCVTPIGLGTVALGRSPRVKSDAEAVEIVRATFEAGINFIDTAPLYGVAERRLGIALRDLAGDVPADLVINTKAGYRPDPFDYSEQQTIACVEKSLDLLGLNFIHYVHIHDVQRSEITTVLNGALRGLQKLKEQKVVGHIGVAGGPIDLLSDYVDTGEFESVITHNRFNLLDQPAASLIHRANELGMAVVNAAPFASGILAQPDNPDTPYVYHPTPPDVKKRVERIAAICKDFDVDLPATAVGFSTKHPEISVTILGAATPAEIRAAAKAAEAHFDQELWTVIAREVPPNLVDNVEEWRKTGARDITL